MDTKLCGVCRLAQSVNNFTRRKKSTDGLNMKCKSCMKVYIHRHYLSHKRGYMSRAKAKKVRCIELLRQLKDNKPCADCAILHRHFALDYDHITGTKIMAVSILANRGQINKMLREIAKCQLVCATCHRYRTFNRKQNSRGGS